MRLARAAAVAAATTAVVAGTTLAASAITGGQVDAGSRHPNVALIAFHGAGGLSTCTASLVSSTVLLTAGHCTAAATGTVAVTFDSHIADAPPVPFPVAADRQRGFTTEEVEAAGYLPGAAKTHPGFSGFTDRENWNDVGVVVLDEPVAGVSPVRLAPENYLDKLAPNVLNKTLFEVVGYGTEVRQPESGPQKPLPQPFPLVRRFGEAPGQKLTDQVLQVNGNENDPRGDGGSCLGDSGGPALLDGYQVSVTSYSLTPNCRYIAGLQRVDIPAVQDWLAGVGVAPAS
jgi:hypothetical protein